jgi:2-alkyl-3-oxoalkanoate reductase
LARILIAGATGVVGARVLRMLVRRGDEVAGLVRSDASAAAVASMGAVPVRLDIYERQAVRVAFEAFRPEVVVHQMTALAGVTDLRKFDAAFAETNRLRTTGTQHLLEAAAGSGVRRFVSQGYCGWPYARTGGPVKSESDPLDPSPAPQFKNTLDALVAMEQMVTRAPGIEGVVLRYGAFYGPQTNFAPEGSFVLDVKRRRVPLIGNAGGMFSFIHIDDVARATVAAIDGRAVGVFNVTDDDPAAVADWLPYLAQLVGAKAPLRLPAWLMRLLIPRHVYDMMTTVRGGSNAKFKQAFAWTPIVSSWRDGFKELAVVGT